MTLLTSRVYSSEFRHRPLLEIEKTKNVFVWEETLLNPFDELIVSWNAKRPTQGFCLIQVSLLMTDYWSPWLDYASWGAHDQRAFKKRLPESNVQVYQDIVETLEGAKANGFKVRAIAKEMASLELFESLHSSAIDRDAHVVGSPTYDSVFIDLEVKGLSQLALPDERRLRLCSPTSMTAVIRFLSHSFDCSVLEFANNVADSAFDIYGNWILNTAQAYCYLKKPWSCFVAHFTSFNQIIDQLRKGYPVIVSVKGPLNGGAFAYESGHLLVAKGYDSKSQEVFCLDPAFPANESTLVKYALSDFLAAWRRRQGIAYVFDK